MWISFESSLHLFVLGSKTTRPTVLCASSLSLPFHESWMAPQQLRTLDH